MYIPRDESFGHLKSSDFLIYQIKSLSQNLIPDSNSTRDEFDSFDEVYQLYEGGIKLNTSILSKISPLPVLKEIFRTDGENVLQFPKPHVIRGTWYLNITTCSKLTNMSTQKNSFYLFLLSYSECAFVEFIPFDNYFFVNFEKLVSLHG